MKGTSIAPTLCPVCGYAVDATTSLASERGPRPGDLSICLSCGALTLFDADLRPLLPVDDATLAEMQVHTRLEIKAARDLIRARGPLTLRGKRA